MALDQETILTGLGALVAGYLGKVGLIKVKERRALESDDEPQLSDPLRPRETVLLYVTKKIQEVKDEINPRLLEARFIRLERDQLETKQALANAIESIHAHIDKRQDKLEEKFDSYIERRRSNS